MSNVLRYGSLLTYNPYYWNPFADMFAWNPAWLITANELASYAMLSALILHALRDRNAIFAAASIVFLVFCKTHGNVQFWYFLLLPSFLVTLKNEKWRWWLIALCPLLDIGSVIELVGGSLGQLGYHGLASAFSLYRLP